MNGVCGLLLIAVAVIAAGVWKIGLVKKLEFGRNITLWKLSQPAPEHLSRTQIGRALQLSLRPMTLTSLLTRDEAS